MIQLVNKIEFPLNSAAYLRKARLSFREGENEEALGFIEQAYELDKDIQINIFYAFMLSQFERYAEALEIMNQEKSIYINSANHAVFYTEILIKTYDFIEAEYIIQKYMSDPTNIDRHTWNNLEQALILERKKSSLEASVREENIKKSLRELGQYSHMAQVNKIREAEILNLSELQEVAQNILISTEISDTVQRYLLELLSNKGDQNVYSFLWFNQIKNICPVELPKFADIALVDEICEKIEEKLAKYPDLKMRVEIEIMHDLLLLYPYIEQTITDVDFWIDAYIKKLDFFNYLDIQDPVETEEKQDMLDWINYLNTVAQRDEMFTD